MATRPIERVSPEEIRRIFAEADYEGRVQRGEVLVRIIEDNHPSRTKANEPFCTRSQMIQYRRQRDNAVLVLAHRYLRTDGAIGASGKPDPKKIYLADRILVIAT